MGLRDWFVMFTNNLKVRNTGSISTRYKAINRRINNDFWSTSSEIEHSRYVGSYGRNTAIEGFSDLDMIFRLPYGVYVQYNQHRNNGQSSLLQSVKKSIEKTYSTTNIRADGQVIQVPFTDGLTYEIVPGFIHKDNSYTYPDANNGGKWRVTNPIPEIEAIRARNEVCNRNLVFLCRMMRAWKRKWQVPVSGLLVDTFAYQFFDDYEYRKQTFIYYDFICRDFFLRMSEQSRVQEYWLAPGSGQRVYGKGLFQYKAKRCYNLAKEAIEHQTATPKREWSAKQKWKEIFGKRFPG